jgi:hypothetical protein
MAIQGKAGKSATGASMSKYDIEVEGRLNVIEGRLAEIEVKLHQLSEKLNAPAAPAAPSAGWPDGLAAALKEAFPGKFKHL